MDTSSVAPARSEEGAFTRRTLAQLCGSQFARGLAEPTGRLCRLEGPHFRDMEMLPAQDG